MLNVSHLGNEVPGSKKIIIIIIYRFLERHKSLGYRSAIYFSLSKCKFYKKIKETFVLCQSLWLKL